MAPRAKPPGKKGNGKPLKDQINGLDPSESRDFLDQLHAVHDEMDEDRATSLGKINRIYEKAADKMDVAKEALTFLFTEERGQRKKAARAAKMDSRARDSLERLAASLPEESALATWASNMAKLAASQPAAEA